MGSQLTEERHGRAKKKSSKAPIFLIGCGVVGLIGIIILGVVAAIAIPAFVKLTNRTKAIEGQYTVMKIANEIAVYYMDECKFPPSAAPSSPIPTGGDKTSAKFTGPGWDELTLSMEPELFFSYRTESQGDAMTVIAEADFKSGPPSHQVAIEIQGTKDSSGNCDAKIGEAKLTNELE